MGPHIAARFHAWTVGLFRPGEATQTRLLFGRVRHAFKRAGLLSQEDREDLMHEVAGDVLVRFGLDMDHTQAQPVLTLVGQLFDYEGLFLLPEIDWQEPRGVAAWWELRDDLNRQKQVVSNYRGTTQILVERIATFTGILFEACPTLLDEPTGDDHIAISTQLVDNIGQIGSVTEDGLICFFGDELQATGLFARLSDRLERNLVLASGGNPDNLHGFNKAPRLPTKSDIKDPRDLLATYLGGTPLLDYFEQQVDFAIPTASRFEHHHIIAGSGHGKTQTLQYLIGKDLDAVAAGKRTVIVLDSQGDLIRNISNLAEFAPGGALHDRVVIIDPTDVEYPVSLNLFDVGVERLQGYAPLERERLTNSILELYDFVLGTLLSAEMTQKQNVIFRYVTRLMLHIPGATIHTLRELMEPGSEVKFASDIAKLSGTAKHFFETEFASREFAQTKKQVLRRLWGILENQTFDRMFSHPRSKLDLFAEMNAGKIILINTAKDLLKEQGTQIFGRFFIAMIAQAAQERATLPEHKRRPTFVYIDEAADYFDRNIGIILSQARKYNVGMVLAHQYLGQLEPRLQDAFAANTSIKFAGGVSAKDARTMAPMLYCDPGLIESQPKGSFAAHIRGVTPSAVPLTFPFGYLEDKLQMSEARRQALQETMRARYAVHYTDLEPEPEPEEPEPEEKPGVEQTDKQRDTEDQIPKPGPKGHGTDAGSEL